MLVIMMFMVMLVMITHGDVGDDDDGVKRENQQVERTARVDGVDFFG